MDWDLGMVMDWGWGLVMVMGLGMVMVSPKGALVHTASAWCTWGLSPDLDLATAGVHTMTQQHTARALCS